VEISDPNCSPIALVSGDVNNDGVLNPGETWVYTCEDGTLASTTTNVAAVSASFVEPGLSGTVDAGPVTATVRVQNPGLLILKSVDTQFVRVGTDVTYSYSVENVGGTSFSQAGLGAPVDLVADDSGVPVVPAEQACSTIAGPFNELGVAIAAGVDLDPGDTWFYECTTALTGDVLNVFNFPNAVDEFGVEYTPPPGVEQVFVIDPGITVTKVATTSVGGPGVDIIGLTGEKVTYTISVTADAGVFDDVIFDTDGNVIDPFLFDLHSMDITVEDPICTTEPMYVSGDTNENGLLEPRETWIYTCDLDALPAATELEPDTPNTATVTATIQTRGLDDEGNPVDADDGLGDLVETADAIVTPAAGELELIKTVDPLTVSEPGEVTYTFAVTNTGPLTVSNITVSDPLLDSGTITCVDADDQSLAQPFELAAGESATCAAPYDVNQTQIDAGSVVNTATAAGEDPAGEPVTDDGEVTLAVTQEPELSVVKVLSANADEDDSGTVTVGDTLTYTVTATNSGNVTLTDVVVSDDLLTPDSFECLSVAPLGTCVLTGTYTVTQANVDAGVIENTGVVAASDPEGDPVGPVETTVDTPVPQEPELSVVKVLSANADEDDSGTVTVGDTLTYTVTATNSGNVTLTDVVVSDDLLTPDSFECPSVAPLGTCVLTGTYTVTQANVDAGVIENTGVVAASDPDGDPVGPVETTVNTPVPQEPELSVVKSTTATSYAVDDVLTYTLVVTNTGNVTLFGIEPTDPAADPGSIDCDDFTGTLAPDDSVTCTATITITADELLAGAVINTATATGNDPNGDEVIKDSNTVTVVALVAVDDSFSTLTNVPVEDDVSGNDTFPPGSTFAALDGPAVGTLELEPDGTFIYTPPPGFSGVVTFTYEVCLPAPDADDCAEATVTITVGPAGADDTATTPTNTPVTVDVLANDPSGPSLTVDEVTNGTFGVVTPEDDGTVTYSPDPGFSGIDTFTYTACDAEGQCVTQSVTVTVTPVGADDTASTPTNTPVTVEVLANDPSGPSLEVTDVTDGENGTVVIDADGTVTYTPDTGFSGIDTFTYTATDGDGQTITQTVTVTVTPVGVDDTATTPTNTAVSVDVLDNDPSGPSLEVTEVTDGADGTVVIEDDGTVTYTPDTGFSGVDTFTYTATDGDGQTITQTVTVTVTPVGADDTATTPTNTAVSVEVLANDPSGPSLEVTDVTDGENGTVVIDADGTVTYTPDTGFSGIDTFTYTATDGDGQTITQTVTVTVTPVGANDTASTPTNTPVTVEVLENDPSGPSLTVTSVTDGANGTVEFDAVEGTVTYTPDTGFSGTDTFTYTACDDAGQCVTQSVTVTVTPVGVDDTASTPTNTPVTVEVLENDPSGPSLTVTSVTDGANGTVEFDAVEGTVTYTPAEGFSGTDTFTYTACDDAGQCVTQSVTVTVTPVGVDDVAVTEPNTPVNVDVLDNDPTDNLTVTAVSVPPNGTAVIDADGTVTYTPATGFSGTDTFTYTACDAEDRCVTQTVTVTVSATGADDTATTPTNTPVNVDVLDNDPAGPSSTVTALTQPSNGTAEIELDGTVTYTPAEGFSGVDTFTYTACDDEGQCYTQTVTVTVTPVGADDTATTPTNTAVNVDVLDNDPSGVSLTVIEVTEPENGTAEIELDGTVTYTPDTGFSGIDTFTYTATDGDGQTITQTVTVTVTPVGVDDTATTPTNTAVNVDVLDNDPSGVSLTVIEVTEPENGTAEIELDGTVTYTPDTGFSGIDTFTYTATDGDGQTITQTVTVTVTPVGADDTATTPTNTAVNVDVLDDVLDNDPSGVSLTVIEVTEPENGTAEIELDGTVTYTPDTGFSGIDTFTYTATDGDGQTITQTVTVTVTPVGVDDTATTPTNTAVNVDVLDNDPSGVSLTVIEVTEPENGTAEIELDGTVTYTPDTGFSGIDTFTYTATDGDGQTITQTVTVTVTPVGADDTATTPTNTAVSVDVLDNDPSGVSLTVIEVTEPENGTAEIELDGTVTYTPDTGFSGIDTFTYTATDGDGQTITQTVTVTVTPVGVDDTATTPTNTAVNVDVLDNDPSGVSLTVIEVTEPENGTAEIELDGTVTYTPDTGFSGIDTFTYTATDGDGQTITQTVTVTVTPVGADDTATTPTNTAVSVEVLANDPSGPSLEVTDVTDGENGTVVIDVTVTYTPDTGFSGIERHGDGW
jgi:uncharacterized repeat protein (TIGR01451 family)